MRCKTKINKNCNLDFHLINTVATHWLILWFSAALGRRVQPQSSWHVYFPQVKLGALVRLILILCRAAAARNYGPSSSSAVAYWAKSLWCRCQGNWSVHIRLFRMLEPISWFLATAAGSGGSRPSSFLQQPTNWWIRLLSRCNVANTKNHFRYMEQSSSW